MDYINQPESGGLLGVESHINVPKYREILEGNQLGDDLFSNKAMNRSIEKARMGCTKNNNVNVLECLLD